MSHPATASSARVIRTVQGMPTSDGAGVKLRRVIGTPQLPDLDPFLMLDEFGTDRAEDYIAGFPEHPHRGFETVTYMLDGRMRHRDNHGNEGLLVPGAVQWMTAGRGVVHSEMPEQEAGRMRGFQLWVNLPARLKMSEPALPGVRARAHPGGASRRGRLGEGDRRARDRCRWRRCHRADPAAGHRAAVPGHRPGARPGLVDRAAGRPQRLRLRLRRRAVGGRGHGCATAGDAHPGRARRRRAGGASRLAAPGARAILVAGRPLREPVAKYGPFVMNTKEELMQAFVDYQEGRF